MPTIDFVIHIISILFFSPILATLVPISLYFSTDISTASIQFRLSLAYACSLWIYQCLSIANSAIRRGSLRPPSRLDWSHQIVVVTGGANGLGHALVSIMAMKRACVVSIDKQPPDNPVQGVTYLTCDITDDAQLLQTAKLAKKQKGIPTIVVSNAGIMKAGAILEMDMDTIDAVISVNLRSQFLLARSFLPMMLQKDSNQERERIQKQWVTISSSLGHVGVLGLSAYCASKAGTISFHESLTAELRALNSCISTTLIVPGQLDSTMFQQVRNPSTFLAPTVGVFELAKEVVQKLECGGAVDFGMPWYANWIGFMRVVPSGMQYLLRRMSGMDEAVLRMIAAQKDKRT